MIPKGYGHGGYEKDNTLAYSDIEETLKERADRKQIEFENKLDAEADAGEIRRDKLTELAKSLQTGIHEDAMKVTEDDIEFIQGEQRFEQLERRKCCWGGNYVDKELETGDARVAFILTALQPAMMSYAVASVYALLMTFMNPLRAFCYNFSPTYVIVSLCFWLLLSILGRVIRRRRFMILFYILRALAFTNLIASMQLYSEYYVWEVLFADSSNQDDNLGKTMQQTLEKEGHFQESWLDLPKDTHVNDFGRRWHFSHAYFGSILTVSFFFSTLSVIIGLRLRSKRKDMTPEGVTDNWMQRTAVIAALAPPFLLFVASKVVGFLPPPNSARFLQIFPIGVASLGFGILVSSVWESLFQGETCFHVHKEDALYFGFMFSL